MFYIVVFCKRKCLAVKLMRLKLFCIYGTQKNRSLNDGYKVIGGNDEVQIAQSSVLTKKRKYARCG